MPRHAVAALSLFGGLVAAQYPVTLPSIPVYGAQVVTAHDQIVYLPGGEKATRTASYSDHVVTTTVPATGCPTAYGEVAEGWSDSYKSGGPLVIVYRKTVEYVEVYEKTVSCPYSEIGPHAFPGYAGNSECTSCSGEQTAYVKECSNNNCAAYQCYYGADGKQHCDDYIKPNGYVVAPPGCEIVSAQYPSCYNGACFFEYAYYTVPIVVGFPVVYQPGVCKASTCLLPPGWAVITTTLPGHSTATTYTAPTTTVTATTTTTTTATGLTTVTSGGAVAPTPNPNAPLTCPADDRTVFIADSGTTFLIECNVGVSGTEINARDAEKVRSIAARDIGAFGTFNGCIQQCDNIPTCEAVSWNSETGRCRGFTDAVVNANPAPNEFVATVIRRAAQPSATSSLTSSTTAVETSSSSSTADVTTTVAATTTTDAGVTTTAAATTTTDAGVTTTATADPSASNVAREVRDQLVPKRIAKKAAGSGSRIQRRNNNIRL